MVTRQRIRDLRERAGLRQEDLAFLLGVGVATILRWESKTARSTRPSGLPLQILEIMDELDEAGESLDPLVRLLRHEGSVGALRWLLNFHANQGSLA